MLASKKKIKNLKYADYTSSATLIKRAKIMPVCSNYAKHYACIIYMDLDLTDYGLEQFIVFEKFTRGF